MIIQKIVLKVFDHPKLKSRRREGRLLRDGCFTDRLLHKLAKNFLEELSFIANRILTS